MALLHHGWLAIQDRYQQWDNEEAAVVFQMQGLRHGQLPYRPLTEEPPWIVGTYPPAFIAMGALAMGGSAGQPADYAGPRALVLFFLLLGTMGLIGLATYRGEDCRADLIGRVMFGTVVGCLFLSSMEVYRWAPYVRMDFPALAFSILGLFIYVRWPTRFWSVWVSCSCFVLAGYCKQTAIAAPLACVLHTLFQSGWRKALRLAMIYAGIGLLPFIMLTMMTGGQFPIHTILYNRNTMSWDRLLDMLAHVGRFHVLFLAAAVLGGAALVCFSLSSRRSAGTLAGGPLYGRGSWKGQVDLRLIWFLLAWAQFPTIAKAGTAENYLLEPLAATACLAGTGALAFIGHKSNLSKIWAWCVVGVVVSHGIHLRGGWGGPDWRSIVYRPMAPHPAAREAFFRVLGEARRRGEPFFAEFGNYHLALGHPILFQPFIMSELARQGLWDPAPFLRLIETGQLKLIILQRPVEEAGGILTPDMVNAIQSQYRLWDQGPIPVERPSVWTYVPRSNGN
jgi:hypothetical protein